MDFYDRVRLKEIQMSKCGNVENAKETMTEVPKILSPEIHDVFHIFVSMLDLKSFVRLTMTSKEMYKRCMEDKQIRINIHFNSLDITSGRSSWMVKFCLLNVRRTIRDGYVAALRKFPCKITLNTLYIQDSPESYASIFPVVQRYLNEIGVNKIHELSLHQNARDWVTPFAIIKDFSVRFVDIDCPINNDILRSILQLNLEKLTYHGRVPLDFILEIDSPIQEICFPEVRQVSKEELSDIMSKIHSGSLHRLTVDSAAFDCRTYDKLPFDYQGQLPDDRPLLLERNPANSTGQPFIREHWFIHWHGGITKLITRFESRSTLEIFKCEPWELPWILRMEADVLNDLAEKRPRVSCSDSHFRTFSSSFTMIDPFYKGPLPENRPLYFQVSENNFWMLDEDEKLMECTWEEGCATWEPFSVNSQKSIEHPALAKYIFWQVLNQVDEHRNYSVYCKNPIECLSGFRTLGFEYSGALPSERPLIFEMAPKSPYSERRIVLLEDRLLQCNFLYNRVNIHICHFLNRPPILFTAKNVVEMLKHFHSEDVHFNISFEIFREGLELFKKSILVLQKRLLISEKMETEFWYCMDDLWIRKVTWENGRLFIYEVNDLLESPPHFMEQVFRNFAEAKLYRCSLKMDLEQIHKCLQQFTVVPFDYSGPLTTDSPMAFVKDEISHISFHLRCSENRFVHIWFLWNGMRLTKCLWGERSKKVSFGVSIHSMNMMPPALKSKEYLKLLLQGKYGKTSRFSWFGDENDFNIYLEDYLKLPFDYDGPLPQKRPLCFENNANSSNQLLFILREDGTIIQCGFSESQIWLSFISTNSDIIPPVLRSKP